MKEISQYYLLIILFLISYRIIKVSPKVVNHYSENETIKTLRFKYYQVPTI